MKFWIWILRVCKLVLFFNRMTFWMFTRSIWIVAFIISILNFSCKLQTSSLGFFFQSSSVYQTFNPINFTNVCRFFNLSSKCSFNRCFLSSNFWVSLTIHIFVKIRISKITGSTLKAFSFNFWSVYTSTQNILATGLTHMTFFINYASLHFLVKSYFLICLSGFIN